MRLNQLVNRSTSRRILSQRQSSTVHWLFERPKVRSVAGGMASIAKPDSSRRRFWG